MFTGKLRIDRKQAEAKVKSLGATVPSGVTKTLTYLVVGDSDRDQPSTKQKAAEKLIADGSSLRVIDETAFENLIASLTKPNAITELPVTIPSPPTIVPEAASSPDPIADPIADSIADSIAEPTSTQASGAKPDPKKRQLTLF